MKPKCNTSDYHGLENQGSTCYLNCVLQVLYMTKDFREAVESSEQCSETPGTVETMDHQLQDLFHELKTRTARTRKITSTLGIENVFEQRDAAEYLEKILRSLTSQEASKIFCGQLRHRNTCCACQTHVDEDGPCWSLPLALTDNYSKHYSVVDGVEAFFSASTVDGDDQMYCDRCDVKTDATIKCEIKTHPEVLTLLLKRFEFDCFHMEDVKIDSPVNVPRTLQIPENQTYELYAVVDHFGNLRGGHYTATIKSQDDNRWYKFDDTNVTEVTRFQEDTTESCSAYLLMYRKKKMHAPDTSVQEISQEPSPQRQQVDTFHHDEQCHDALKKRKREDCGETAEKRKDALNSVSPERSENGTEETENGEVLKNKVEKENTSHEQSDNPAKHRQRKEGDEAERNDPAEAALTKRQECVTEDAAAVSVKNKAVSAPPKRGFWTIYDYYKYWCQNLSCDTTDQGSGGENGVTQKKPFEAQERKQEVVDSREKEKGDEATEKDNNSVESVSVERSECGTEETGSGEGASVGFGVENDAEGQGNEQSEKNKNEKQLETGHDEQLDCTTKRGAGNMTKRQVGNDAQNVKGEDEPTASTQNDLAKRVQNLKLSESAVARRKKRRTKRTRRVLKEAIRDGTDSRVQKRINETDAPVHSRIKHKSKYKGVHRERQSRRVRLRALSVRRKNLRKWAYTAEINKHLLLFVDFLIFYIHIYSPSFSVDGV